MKILIYVELFPIRENKLEYYNVAKYFANSDLNQKLGVRFVTNDEIRLRLKKECSLNETQFLPLTDEARSWIADNDSEWHEDAIIEWKKYIKSTDNTVLTRYLTDIKLNLYDFDTVIIWGKNNTVKKLARELSFNIVFAELTPSRSPFFEGVFLSDSGVNGDHVINEISHIEASPPSFFHKETVVLALQLFDDANFQLFSPFKEFKSLIDKVRATFPSPKYSLFIKRHPYSHLRKINKVKEDLAIEYATSIGFAEYTSKERHFLTKFDNIVSINSSACFEGALLGKKVFILGDSCYKGAIVSFKSESTNDSGTVYNYENLSPEKIALSAENFSRNNFYSWRDCAKFFTSTIRKFEKNPFLLPLHKLIGEKVTREDTKIHVKDYCFETEKKKHLSSEFKFILNRKYILFDRDEKQKNNPVLLLEVKKSRVISGATFSANTFSYTVKSNESDYILLVGYSLNAIKLIEVKNENYLF